MVADIQEDKGVSMDTRLKCRAELCSQAATCLLWLEPIEPGQVEINPDPWLRGTDRCARYAPVASPTGSSVETEGLVFRIHR